MVESFKELHNEIYSVGSFDLEKTNTIKDELLAVIQTHAYTDRKGKSSVSDNTPQ